MKFNDLLALAKAGYTVADVKELLSLGSDQEDKGIDVNDGKETEVNGSSSSSSSTKDSGDVEEESPESEEKDDKTDYKALYEQKEKELKDLQAKNRREDKSGSDDEVTDEELALDIARAFM